jgi:hypothetical protein
VTAIDATGQVRIWRIAGSAQQVISPLPAPQDVSQYASNLEVVSAGPDGSGTVVHSYASNGSARGSLTIIRSGSRIDDLSDNGRLLIDAAAGAKARASIWDLPERRMIGRLPPLPIVNETWYGSRLLLDLRGSAQPASFQFDSVTTYDPRSRRLGPRMNAVLPPGCRGQDAAVSANGTRVLVTDYCDHLATYDPNSGKLIKGHGLRRVLPRSGSAGTVD